MAGRDSCFGTRSIFKLSALVSCALLSPQPRNFGNQEKSSCKLLKPKGASLHLDEKSGFMLSKPVLCVWVCPYLLSNLAPLFAYISTQQCTLLCITAARWEIEPLEVGEKRDLQSLSSCSHILNIKILKTDFNSKSQHVSFFNLSHDPSLFNT